MKLQLPLFFLFLVLSSNMLNAQIDSIILLNDDVIVGEIKSMDKGVLTIETDYSDVDFKIEWKGIMEIYTASRFLITTSEGARYNGPLQSTGPRQVNMITDESGIIAIDMTDIVYLNPIDEGFSSRLYAAIDLSYSFTKAQNLVNSTFEAMQATWQNGGWQKPITIV